MTTQRNERQAELDAAVLEALADGEPHTGDDVQKATDAATAHVMSSLRRLALEDRVAFTSAKGKRVYVRTDVEPRSNEAADGASDGEVQDGRSEE